MEKIELLLEHGDKMFNERSLLLDLWQTIAENFYPERADFTYQRAIGEEFGADLLNSYPVMVRRDLGNSITSILRPTNKEWMHLRVRHRWDRIGVEGRAWLEWAEGIMRRAMYDRHTMFVRATREADHDFATFGQAVIQPTLNFAKDGLLFKTWHLRDVAWMESEDGKICHVIRKSKPKVYDMCRWFPNTVHADVKKKLDKQPYDETNMWHVVMLKERWGGTHHKFDFVSLYVDPDHKTVLEEKPVRTLGYVIPRWSTVSGSQYSVSPATCIALPDAKMLQAMVSVLLEAGEKAVNPPMVANKDVFGGNFSIYAGATTWADFSDGRISDYYSVLPQDKSGIPLGRDMAQDIRAALTEAFYLNKLTLPPPGPEMTAYEVGQRVQEYIRQAMPLFEPMEQEYNGPFCEEIFDIMMHAGAFGSPYNIPDELRGEEIEFAFESPLHDAVDKAKSQKLLEAKSLITEVMDADPSAPNIMDFKVALRDVLLAVQTPAKWLRSEAEVAQKEAETNDTVEAQRQLELAQQSANVAATISSTGEAGVA